VCAGKTYSVNDGAPRAAESLEEGDHAIQALEQALDVDGSEAILHYNLACYWTLARNRTLAISYLSQALDIDANFRDLVLEEPDFVTLHQDPAFKLIAGTVV
jgi:tetratricopeptide (TPR) repeat protein